MKANLSLERGIRMQYILQMKQLRTRLFKFSSILIYSQTLDFHWTSLPDSSPSIQTI